MSIPKSILKLQFRALAISHKGTAAGDEDREKLRDAMKRCTVAEVNEAGPPAALLWAVSDFFCERGPLLGVPGMLGQAVRLCTEEWASKAEPNTPQADPTFWYQEGDMG